MKTIHSVEIYDKKFIEDSLKDEEKTFKKVWEEISNKLEIKEFRYGKFPPKHGVNISDIKNILYPIIKRLTSNQLNKKSKK